MNPRDHLIVALDVPSAAEARGLIHRLRGAGLLFKVGSELFTAAGPVFVRELVEDGERVFLDLKYHDIPTTVGRAVRAAAGLGVTFVDVHALGGTAIIEAAAAASGDARLLAITVLTSHDESTLREIGVGASVAASVRDLARLARAAGAHGVVASPHEVAAIRAACGAAFLIVTPGIRPAGASPGDQARAATPAAALAAGADYLVVGRPITAAPDPAAAAAAILAEMDEALRAAAR